MRSLPAIVVTALAAAAAPATGQAQEISCFLRGATMEEAAQRPSPLGETEFLLGGQEGKVCYGRPSARGRKIMGELVPFGEPWRLGANEATAIHLPFAAMVGGVHLEPGTYSLFAIPGEADWEFVLNRNAERWGIPINDALRASDLGSFKRPAGSTEGMVEQLTIRWEGHTDTMGQLIIEWEHTRVEIPVERM